MARKTNEETIKIEEMNVSHVREVKGKGRNASKTVFFTLTINGVSINNCRVVSGRNGDFIGLPQYKSGDEYYNVVWIRFSDEDQDAILQEVEAQL